MASKSIEPVGGCAVNSLITRLPLSVCLAAAIGVATSQVAAACPFCTTPKPTISARLDAANVVAIAEWIATEPHHERLRVIKLLKSRAGSRPEQLVLPADVSLRRSGLWLALGRKAATGGELDWETLAVDELGLAYIARLPSTRRPARERLEYFCRYLENPDPLIADDAYGEFGLADFDEVAKVARRLPMASLRGWLADPGVPEQRKGFYGMALGLAETDADRAANIACLRKLIEKPASDFRAGFDGVLAGYLLLQGDAGLEEIARRLLASGDAPLGDVLHAMTALRFYHEYGHGIPPERLAEAMARLIARPEVAPQAIIDLARWQAWQCLPQVAGALQPQSIDQPLARAVIGYLLCCPSPQAAEPLAAWRRAAPELVAEVERGLSLPRRE